MTTTNDEMPTAAQIWQALKGLFGTRLEAASVQVITKTDDSAIKFSVYTFPHGAP